MDLVQIQAMESLLRKQKLTIEANLQKSGETESGRVRQGFEVQKLKRIEDSLERLQEGDYGICEECGEEIPFKRLKANPYAQYCIRCQQDLEKRSFGVSKRPPPALYQ